MLLLEDCSIQKLRLMCPDVTFGAFVPIQYKNVPPTFTGKPLKSRFTHGTRKLHLGGCLALAPSFVNDGAVCLDWSFLQPDLFSSFEDQQSLHQVQAHPMMQCVPCGQCDGDNGAHKTNALGWSFLQGDQSGDTQ